MPRVSEKQSVAIAVFVLLAIYVSHYYAMLPDGALKHMDEYWTLDRTGSFVRTHDWFTVLSENQANFNKPPLQYWASAFFLENGFGLEYSLRFPSFVFSICLLLVTGFLAYQLHPRLIVFPISIMVLASSYRYWESALSALLDMGASFLATVSIIGLFAALRQPKWWYLVALSVGLSAMQKAPIALAGVLIALGVFTIWHLKYGIPDYRASFSNKHFWFSLCLLLVLVLIWPVVEFSRYGFAFLQQAYLDQIWGRFASAEGLASNSKTTWSYGLGLFRAQPLLEVPFIIAIAVLPFVIKRAESYVLTVIFLIFVVLEVVAGKHGSPRYSLILYPAMAASLSAVITYCLDRRALIVAVAFSLIGGQPLKSEDKLGISHSGQVRYLAFLTHIKNAISADETLIRCRWNRGHNPLFPGAISYYASNGNPIFVLTSPDKLDTTTASPPYRGVCTSVEFAELARWLDAPVEVEIFENYVHWKAKGPAAIQN